MKISTFASGTRSVSSLVASSPSIPGMRTSMITTSGLRLVASSTALAPSLASPITRMCDARESDRRSPSRTTSWSSTIRQVISSGIRLPILCRSRRKLKLLRLGRRLEPDGAAVGDPVRPLQLRYVRPHRLVSCLGR